MRIAKCNPYEPLQIVEEAQPELPPNGVLVKVSFAGVCHSDIHIWEDGCVTGENEKITFSAFGVKYPVTLGHEISGVVSQLSDSKDEGVTDLCIGDNVMVYPWAGCGVCYLCLHGEDTFCEGQTKNHGLKIPGGYAEYVVVPHYRYCIKVPSSVSMATAALLPCSGVTAYNAVTKGLELARTTHKMRGNVGIVIVGAGGLGLWAIKFAKIVMPENTKIVSVDVQEEKILVAKEAGADDGVIWKDVPSDEIAKQTRLACGGYVDIVIDFVNSTNTHNQGIKTIRKGGLIVPVGLFGGKSSLPLPLMVFQQWNIAPALVGSVTKVRETLELVKEHKISAPDIRFYSLEQVNDALEDLRNGKIRGRAVLKM